MDVRRQALAAALLALAAAASSANEVDIRLERVPLYQLARMVLGELLHEPYVLDGALITAEDVATVDARRIEPAKALELLEALLRAHGFVLEHQAGVTLVKRTERKAEKEKTLVYRPKYRSVAYLQGAVRTFLPAGRFAGAGSFSAAASQALAATGSSMTAATSGTQAQAQSAVSSVVPAQGPVLASQDVLVFEGSEGDVAKLERLVSEFDRPAREVVVKAYILEVGSSASDGSGVSLAVNLLGGRLSASTSGAPLPNSATVRIGELRPRTQFSIATRDSRF